MSHVSRFVHSFANKMCKAAANSIPLNRGTLKKHADRIGDRVRTHYLSNDLIDGEQITSHLKYREFTEAKLKHMNNLSIDRRQYICNRIIEVFRINKTAKNQKFYVKIVLKIKLLPSRRVES